MTMSAADLPDLDAAGQETVLDEAAVLDLLREGDIELEGRLVDASNATLFGSVTRDGLGVHAVYKPVRGERPLWDFPDGTLAGREVSTFLVSAATGWDVVPPTVLRDGPFGIGMVQLWIEVDESVDVERLVRSTRDRRMRRMAAFDAVVNNGDRKGGHVLPTEAGHVYGCDHGVTFNTADKLRTLLWQWRGQPLDEGEVGVLTRLRGDLGAELGSELAGHLTAREVLATMGRVERLLAEGTFPQPSGDWPAIPWPPF